MTGSASNQPERLHGHANIYILYIEQADPNGLILLSANRMNRICHDMDGMTIVSLQTKSANCLSPLIPLDVGPFS